MRSSLLSRTLVILVGLVGFAIPGAATAKTSFALKPSGSPRLLLISRIGVRAPVESISLIRPQDFHAPYRWGDVAWYNRGPRPGDVGRASVYGHLDSTCCPAVFYRLKDLRPGDTTQIVYSNGQVFTFRVVWQRVYWNNRLPISFMFGRTKERGLILETCTGVFHRDGTGYDHKRLVYARLVSR